MHYRSKLLQIVLSVLIESTTVLSAALFLCTLIPAGLQGQTTGSPYTDGGTVFRAIYDIGVDDPSLYTGPRRTDINGDGVFDALDDQEIVRRLDFNGDGQVAVEEELAMRILGRGAYDANPLHFDIPRMIRFGMEVSF